MLINRKTQVDKRGRLIGSQIHKPLLPALVCRLPAGPSLQNCSRKMTGTGKKLEIEMKNYITTTMTS